MASAQGSAAKDVKEQLSHVKFDGYDPAQTKNFELIQRRAEHFAGSFLFYHDPVHIVRGEGAYLFDDEGRRYIDFYNNVQSMGHANPRIAKAIAEQAKTLTTHTRYLSEPIIELSETLAETLPAELDVCLFACTGTEAAELAMRIARTVTGRNGAVVMDYAYHGNSKLVGEMSTGTYPADQRPPYIQGVAPPNTYRGVYQQGREDNLGQRYADLIDPAIEALEKNGEGFAAFVCDTIFDSQGALVAPDDYFKLAFEKVRKAGGLCIADEVQAGVGRTGTYWGFEHYDVVPDIVFTGKPLGGGFPMAAVFTTREIAEKWAKADIYFNTFGGNPVAARAGLAVFEHIKSEGILEHVQDVGGYLVARLEALAQKHSVIGKIEGRGLFIGVELVEDRATKAPAKALAAVIPDKMKEEGILIGLAGVERNKLKFRPPLVVTRDDIDEVIDALDRVLSAEN